MGNALHHAEHGALIATCENLTALVVSGADRSSWLMGMLTCDLTPVEQNRSVHGLVLDKQGKILFEVIVFAHRDTLVLVVDAAGANALREHLDRFLIMEDAEIEVMAAPHAFLLVLGPRASEAATHAASTAGVLAARPGHLFGNDAVLVFVDGERAWRVAELLASEDAGFAAISSDLFSARRIELGIPRFGVDFGSANYPMEVGLDEHAISFSKGCYVGQEVVTKLRSRGKSVRVLRRLVFTRGSDLPTAGKAVFLASGKEVGTVTSATLSAAGAPVGYALLRRRDTESVEHVLVDGQEARLAAVWGLIT